MTLSRRKFLVSSTLVAAGTSFHARFFSDPKGNQGAPAYQDWAWVRRQFPLTDEYVHFATFYLTAHPRPVRDAIQRFTEMIDANPFLVVERGMFESLEENLQVRIYEAAARFTGGRPEEFALVPNTTTGISLVYNGLPLKKGDEILTTDHDHYVHHESIRFASERTGASWKKIALYERGADASVDEILQRVRTAIHSRTRVLGITWVHSSTGVKLPIRRIADVLRDANRNRKPTDRVLMIVDGVHGFGAASDKIAELGCDFFISGTHKWMFAPRGTGVIWAPVENWGMMKPTIPTFSAWEPFAAWMEKRQTNGPTQASWISPGGFIPYEYQWSMVEAFRLHEQIGPGRIEARIRELNGRLKEGLRQIPRVTLHTPEDPELSAGIVCFEVKGMEPEEVVQRLLDRKFIASTTPYAPTYARLSAGIMNTAEEIDRVLKAVQML